MLAQRTQRIGVSPTMKVAAEAMRLKAQGVDIVDLGAGEPDFPTPTHVSAAAHAAIDANFTKYTTNSGTDELKRAVCARYKADYGVDYTTAETIITAGGKQALYNAAMCLFGEGDEVITHMPGWPTLVEQIKLADATPVVVRTHARRGLPAARRDHRCGDHPENPRHRDQLAGEPHRRADQRGGPGPHRRRSGHARHLDPARPLLRAADLRSDAAQPARRARSRGCATARCCAARRRRPTR